MRFIQTGLDGVVSILSDENLSHQEKVARLRKILQRDFDVSTIGKFVLGVHRRGVDPAKLNEYLLAFENHIVSAYVERLVRFVEPSVARSAGDAVKVTGTRPAGTHDIFVRMGVNRPEKEPLEVDWRVRGKQGSLKIIDVYFLGVSMAMAYKQEFASVIRQRNQGIDGLIAALKEHAGIQFSKR